VYWQWVAHAISVAAVSLVVSIQGRRGQEWRVSAGKAVFVLQARHLWVSSNMFRVCPTECISGTNWRALGFPMANDVV